MSKATILIVEDEIVVAQDIQLILIQLGYKALDPVPSGEAALANLEKANPDLVLMDIHLIGELDGIATAELIRQRLDVPIIYLTAHSDDATLRRANVTAPYGYILKPFEERELAIAVDIALYRHRIEQKLHQMERWLASTIKSMGDAVLTADLHGRVTFMNQIAEELTGWNSGEALGRNFGEVLKLVDSHTREALPNLVQRVIQEEMVIEIGANTLLVTRDGMERPIGDSAAPIWDNEGNIVGVVIVFRDVAVRKQVEEQLRYSATHDPLTALPNRAFLMERLTQVIELTYRHPQHKFAVLLLDLDRFKIINDSLGHQAGDQVLIEVAKRLEKELRAPDTLARLGGDEFVVLLEEIKQTRDALMVAERIQNDLKIPITIGAHEVFTGVSIGIVFNDANYQQPDEILRDADNALYRAKATGKGRNVIFDTALHERAMASLRLENDLRRAVTHKEFFFQYQPIVSLATRQIEGLEALLRWQHPERGLLFPDSFLDLAEETGFLNEIRECLLLKACRQIQEWQNLPEVNRPLNLSVNLSRQQFKQTDLVERIAFIISETGIEPNNLCLEITEGVFASQNGIHKMLARLHELGVQLHMDDFGTGYSSLSILHRAPIDTLKIDRTFVKRLNGGGQEESTVVRAIMMLAREMKMNVIAEGIETDKQVEYLKSLNCPYGQGFLFSKPIRAEDVPALLSKPH
jgi:diguanylate cyclase (GGDEF)-like protein/PAS domain S-box-containing protein